MTIANELDDILKNRIPLSADGKTYDVHLRADTITETHLRFTIFINGANCGELCMRRDEAIFFHNLVMLSGYRLSRDTIRTSGQWVLEENA